ncbi:hypothetical protein FPOA_03433 [Fusarium poae]|uniref:Uncharacterized protein n=1 Tax=Fusarium poae TaxID=36050 RepID=A0A1B8B9U7_FUSPO|nr:hypothetical protein FPOA_03433 [Fusarium poae]
MHDNTSSYKEYVFGNTAHYYYTMDDLRFAFSVVGEAYIAKKYKGPFFHGACKIKHSECPTETTGPESSRPAKSQVLRHLTFATNDDCWHVQSP